VTDAAADIASSSGSSGSTSSASTDSSPNPAETSAEGDSDESGVPTPDDSAGESETGMPPEGCGNGVVEDAEACDDDNDNEVDGCTSACETGPLGIQFGRMQPADGEFGGWASKSFQETADCPGDAVLIGIRGDFADYFQYYVLGRVRGVCAPLALINAAPTAVGFGDEVELPLFGEKTGDPFELLCPPNAALTGFYGASGLYTDSVGITCRSLAVAGGQDEVVVGPPTTAGPFGANGNPDRDHACPDGTTGTGLIVSGDTYATTLELRCRPLDIMLPR